MAPFDLCASAACSHICMEDKIVNIEKHNKTDLAILQ